MLCLQHSMLACIIAKTGIECFKNILSFHETSPVSYTQTNILSINLCLIHDLMAFIHLSVWGSTLRNRTSTNSKVVYITLQSYQLQEKHLSMHNYAPVCIVMGTTV